MKREEIDFAFCLSKVSWKIKDGDRLWFRMTLEEDGTKEFFISKDQECKDGDKSPDGINWERIKII